jgi:hypothetical protein
MKASMPIAIGSQKANTWLLSVPTKYAMTITPPPLRRAIADFRIELAAIRRRLAELAG